MNTLEFGPRTVIMVADLPIIREVEIPALPPHRTFSVGNTKRTACHDPIPLPLEMAVRL